MKHFSLSLLAAALFVIMPRESVGQIVNPGFESWTNNQPDGWFTFGGLFNDISKSTIAHSGSASLKATVVLFNNVPTGAIIQSGQNAQGFPVNTRNGSVSGYYQFSPSAGDRFVVAVIMYSGAVTTTAAVGAGDFVTAAATGSTWTKFTVPITYVDNTTVPQTVYIQIAITGPEGSSSATAGSFYLLDDISLDPATAVAGGPSSTPLTYSLDQNYPNPFNPMTTIRYSVPQEQHVLVTVYNELGEEVRTLVNGVKSAGTYSVVWNGETDSGIAAGSGMYFYRIRAGEFSDLKRMILIK